uniref:Importin N-terminal domain-containing protein n=1 Tax=Chromera velia CCMP2878 TaxID=1169474 RepID=A0A0G4GT15_9ALVE|eukprot:Cvel_23256.t1-p1 / transcript=Cvel_23256.t1 / gene=Cvel_23256 / organism=Chromera_velia_CCMP2878 / gene_product=Importin-9, putative / transcript_product=Importin-9, putative / location=Cvel_scaffold2377:1675-9999(+) / protein_length=1070 / sequence_SO=supercontig / SO=protein_coding / is_pseudo=false
MMQLLAGLASGDGPTRTAAENILDSQGKQPGFLAEMAHIAIYPDPDPAHAGSRLLAAVLCKRLVKDGWTTLSEAEKMQVKGLLLESGISHREKPIRTALHVAIAKIADECSLPQGWPELIALIGGLIQQNRQTDTMTSPEQRAEQRRTMECGLECLVVMLEECDRLAASLAPHMDALFYLASGDGSTPAITRRCVNVYRSTITILILSEEKQILKDTIFPSLEKWTQLIEHVITSLQSSYADLEAFRTSFAAVKLLKALVENRGTDVKVKTQAAGVLHGILSFLERYAPQYEAMVVNAEEGGIEEDEEGGPQAFLMQAMEMMATMALKPGHRKAIKGKIQPSLLLFAQYMQLSSAQVSAWAADPNEFLLNEDDERLDINVRKTAESLIDAFFEEFENETLNGVVAAAMRMVALAEEKNGNGNPFWWKYYEVALKMISIIGDCLEAPDEVPPQVLEGVAKIIGQLGNAVSGPHVPLFLRARAFLTAQKLRNFIVARFAGDVDSILLVAAQGVAPENNMVLRVCAMRAFCSFLGHASMAARSAAFQESRVATSIAEILSQATDDVLHLAMDALSALVKHCPAEVAAVEESFSPIVLNVWAAASNDPLVQLAFQSFVASACASSDALRRSLENRLIPRILRVFQLHAELRDQTVGGAGTAAGGATGTGGDGGQGGDDDGFSLGVCVDVLSTLLKRADVPLSDPFWASFELLMKIAMSFEESSFLQSACEVFLLVILRAADRVRQAGHLAAFLQFAERMLSPGMDDRACLFVGPLLTVFIRNFAAELGSQLVNGILRACADRLLRSEMPALQQNLLVVFGCFLNQSCSEVAALLEAIRIDHAGETLNGLEAVIAVWCMNTECLASQYSRNVTYSALTKLLQTEEERLVRVRAKKPVPLQIVEVLAKALREENKGLRLKVEREERRRKHRDQQQRDRGSASLDAEEDDWVDEDDETVGMSGLAGLHNEDDPNWRALMENWDDDDDDDDWGGKMTPENDAFRAMEKEDPLFSMDLQAELFRLLQELAGNGNKWLQALSGEEQTKLKGALEDATALRQRLESNAQGGGAGGSMGIPR